MENKVKDWMQRRAGHFTASGMKKLMTRGTKGRKYGDTAIGYLYQIAYEIRTGRPIRGVRCANFDFGHENEPRAIEWLRNNTSLTIRHCEADYPEITFKEHPELMFIGDSPDFYAVNDNEEIEALGEIKCLASQAKFEEALESTKADVVDEYKEQLATHFLCHPGIDKLYYIIYDGSADDDEFDPGDFNAEDRGVIFTFYRSEFEDLIQDIKERCCEAWDYLKLSRRHSLRIRDINNNV